jgi:hypothetical protein
MTDHNQITAIRNRNVFRIDAPQEVRLYDWR